jgi:hypothetical protein
MSDDKSPLQRLLDLTVFGPAGLAITIGEEFPKLVEKGRHRVEGQVHTARLVGQFAVQMGRQKVESWTAGAGAGADRATPASSSAAAHDAAPETVPETAPEPTAGPVPSVTGNGRVHGTHLAIPGYDSLSASQVVQRLDGLSSAELEEVRAHELASRRRRTVLSRVDQLLAGAPPGPA